MLRKALKYDIKFGKTAFLTMIAAILGLAVFTRIWDTPFFRDMGKPLIITALMVVVSVTTLILVFQNFNKNLFGDEGYLMLTLPVKRYKFLLSKLLTSLMWLNLLLLAAGIASIIFYPASYMPDAQVASEPQISWKLLQALISWLLCNVMASNAVLFMYMASALAHISVAGRRPGWVLGGIALVGGVALETFVGVKLLTPLFNGYSFWVYSTRNGGPMKFAFTNTIYNGQFVNIAYSVNCALVVTITLFCVLAWLVTGYCLKKRVDLP